MKRKPEGGLSQTLEGPAGSEGGFDDHATSEVRAKTGVLPPFAAIQEVGGAGRNTLYQEARSQAMTSPI